MKLAPLVLPASLLVALLLVAPMVFLFRISLNEYSAQTLMIEALQAGNYLRALSDPYYQSILGTTMGVALLSTLLALIIGFPAAYWIARMDSGWKSAAVILTLFPLLVGNVVRAAGWMALLGRDGAINAALRGLGLVGEEGLRLLYTPGAVVIGIVAVVTPYIILTLAAVIEGNGYDLNIGRYLRDAAEEVVDVATALAELRETQSALREAEEEMWKRIEAAGYA